MKKFLAFFIIFIFIFSIFISCKSDNTFIVVAGAGFKKKVEKIKPFLKKIANSKEILFSFDAQGNILARIKSGFSPDIAFLSPPFTEQLKKIFPDKIKMYFLKEYKAVIFFKKDKFNFKSIDEILNAVKSKKLKISIPNLNLTVCGKIIKKSKIFPTIKPFIFSQEATAAAVSMKLSMNLADIGITWETSVNPNQFIFFPIKDTSLKVFLCVINDKIKVDEKFIKDIKSCF